MWQRITTWLRARWPWIAAIGAGLVAVVALFTRRRPPPGPSAPAVVAGLTPAQADAARAQAQAERDREVAAAGQDLQDALGRIAAARARKRGTGGRAELWMVSLLLSASLLGLAACRTQPRPDPGPAPVADAELARPCSSCLAACEALPGDEGCACAEDCERARHAARVARADLRALQATSAADSGELTQRLQLAHQETAQARQETEEARAECWDYFGWGVGAGAAVVAAIILGALLGT